jgi:hypothetical protein
MSVATSYSWSDNVIIYSAPFTMSIYLLLKQHTVDIPVARICYSSPSLTFHVNPIEFPTTELAAALLDLLSYYIQVSHTEIMDMIYLKHLAHHGVRLSDTDYTNLLNIVKILEN